jgi:homoserine dehydrogenase
VHALVQIAILGFGNIGSGVAEVISRGYNLICKEIRDCLHIKYILDLRDFPDHPLGDRVVHDFNIILQDPEVQIVCETMGGTKPAFEYSLACLNAGKSVVTSNKEVVATFGNLLCDAARDHGVRYLYEASVGGGIPIIRSIKSALAGDTIHEINGILNGTTNYILTEMANGGKSFEQALVEAQTLGYAERNPSADINGDDCTRKICILAALAFGVLISPSMVSADGIKNIRVEDVEIARKFGASIKLVGSAKRMSDGKIDIRVSPCLVPSSNPIAKVDGVFNAILVKAECVGDVMFYGPGAGSLPTASAVLSDIIDIAKCLKISQPRQETWQVAEECDVCKMAETPISCYAAVAETSGEVLDVFPNAEILYVENGLTAFAVHEIPFSTFERAISPFTCLSQFRTL